MTVECDQAMGEVHTAVALELLRKVLTQITGNKVLLSGTVGKPIMVSDCDKESRTLLAPHQTREEEEEAEQKSEESEKVEKEE